MKTSNLKRFSPLRMYCDIFDHNYEISKKVTSHVKEYTCTCCKHQLTTNSDGKLIELTPIYQEINTLLQDIYLRKMTRLKTRRLKTSLC